MKAMSLEWRIYSATGSCEGIVPKLGTLVLVLTGLLLFSLPTYHVSHFHIAQTRSDKNRLAFLVHPQIELIQSPSEDDKERTIMSI